VERSAGGRVDERCPWAALQAKYEVRERELRIVIEGRRQLSRDRIRIDGARQLDRYAMGFGGQIRHPEVFKVL
jgi:hypothetical protein